MDKNTLKEEIRREIKIRAARSSYLEYVAFTNEILGYKKTKFHTFLCNKIQEFLEQPTGHSLDILCLSVPPQHGKSLTVSHSLPAYWLGLHPKSRIIVASYNQNFAETFGRANRDKIRDYNKDIFPECVLADYPNNNEIFETTKGGRCLSRGILSGITGNPADLIIIDDVLKTSEEAMSENQREKIWAEYLSSVRTRVSPGAKLIIIGTRWHEEDLIGKIIQHEKNTTIINLPCECIDTTTDPLGRNIGDALCPEIGKGNAWLQDFKQIYISDQGSLYWSALYQGSPHIQEGNILKREWWQYYDRLPDNVPYTIMSVDAAFKDGDNNDYVAIGVWGKINNRYYLVDLLQERLNFTDTLSAIRVMRDKYPQIIFVLIEDKANGTAIINVLSQEMSGVIPIEPQGGKLARVQAVAPTIERGQVWLPRYSSFTHKFIEECSKFPNGAHDDMVDQMSQALNRMIYVDATLGVAETPLRRVKWSQDMYEDYERANDRLKDELVKMWGYPEE